MTPRCSPELIEQMRSAPLTESSANLAKRLGLAESTVYRYRRQARLERQEAAREILIEHVRENVPDALQDLTDLRHLARNKYQETGDARDGTLWLNAIKTTVDHVKPAEARDEFSDWTDEELEQYARTGERPAGR